MFPDTASDAVNCNLSAYFNNSRVQQQLARSDSAIVPAAGAAAGAIASTLAAVAGDVQGQFGRAAAVVRAALAAPQPGSAGGIKAQRQGATTLLREREEDHIPVRRGGSAGGWGSGGRESPSWQHQQHWRGEREGEVRQYPEQWPPGAVARGGAIDVMADPVVDAGAHTPASSADWDDPISAGHTHARWGGAGARGIEGLEDGEGLEGRGPEELPLRHGAGRSLQEGGFGRSPEPWGRAGAGSEQQQQRRRQSPVVRALAPVARGAQALWWAVQQRLPLPRGAAGRKFAAGLIGAAAVVILATQARSPATAAGTHASAGAARQLQPLAATAAAPAASAVFDRAAATRLVRAYQEARWRALGPDWDTAALDAVADGQARAHLRSQSDQYASRGWFQRFKLTGCEVTGVHPAGPGAARVEATLRESSNMYGVDGRRADSVATEYDVVYTMTAGADGRWRVSGFKVLGKEPGAGLGGGVGGAVASWIGGALRRGE